MLRINLHGFLHLIIPAILLKCLQCKTHFATNPGGPPTEIGDNVLDVAARLGATTFLDFVHKTNLTRNFTQTGTYDL